MQSGKKWSGIIAAVAVCLAVSGFVRAGTIWQEKQKLTALDGSVGDYFGCSVSISGDLVIVGAFYDNDNGTDSGSAYIFAPNDVDPNSWVEHAKLFASDGAANDHFGRSVSISGDLAIVGAFYDDDNGTNSGSAYIFAPNDVYPNNWDQHSKLIASDGAADDRFGLSVSISSDYAIVGSYLDDDNGTNSGSAYIFAPNDIDPNNWVEHTKLFASDGVANDQFGFSVSISGDLAIVGATFNDGGVNGSGSAYIFKWNGASWVQQQKLFASDGAANDQFGHSVSISGDLAIVGAPYDDDNGDASGSAYVFRFDGANWVQQQKLLASDGAASDFFSYSSVSISGGYAIVGAFNDDDNGSNSGSAYVFTWDGLGWVEQQKLTASDAAAGDWFGCSVSISSDYAIAGAYYDNDNGSGSGSAYIFVPVGTGELTLLAPNGGEVLVAGSTYDIVWDTNGIIENVFIEYSDNNGANWTAIDTVPNINSYPWLVPQINSNECLLWISDASYPPAGDVSDDLFRIYVCTLSHDMNHDCFVDFSDFSLFASEWLQCGDPCDPDCVLE